MNRSSTPGSPAGPHAAPHGNRARSFDYPEDEELDEVALDPALVTSPGHGAVGVFQPPRPASGRGTSAGSEQPASGRGTSAGSEQPASTGGDSGDIDSPFLDLFGGAQPGARRPAPTAPPSADPTPVVAPPRRGVGHEALPIPHQHAASAESTATTLPGERRTARLTDGAEGTPPIERRTGRVRETPDAAPPTGRTRETRDAAPPTGRTRGAQVVTRSAVERPDEPVGQALEPAPDPTGRTRVPHQPGDRLPVLRPATEPERTAPVERPARRRPTERTSSRETALAPRREMAASASREMAASAPREMAAPASREVSTPPSREVVPPRQRSAAQRSGAPTKPVRARPPRIKFGDRDPSVELAITEIAGHLTFTPNTVTAWYWLPEVRWAFRPDAEREALLSAISEQYAGLAGFRLHLRRTTRPFPADEWARTIDAHTASPLPDVPGTAGWADHLVAAQRHLMAVNHAEGQTYLGVTFARRSLGDSLAERLLRTFGRGTADGERRRLGRTVEQFDEVLGAFGMRGRRVTAQELEWLLYRSVALCMSPPGALSPVTHGRWERGDLLALTEQVERYRTPYGSTVKLVNRMTGEERHVAVLAVGRMEPLEIPERHEPWLHFHERLPWPMELSTRVDILGPGDSFRNLEHRLRMIRSQQLDYAEHGIDAPPELERLAKRALVIGDEMTTGLPVDSARAHGWHRIAVGGRTREECLERARRLIQLYSRELRISLQHPKNQDWLAREFIPGEPIANTGYVRRMPVHLLAAALPQAASTVGDRRGDLIGRTAGTCRRPVFLDLHFPMEVRERSGLAVFVAEPGGGKSTLLGALGYLAARRGVQVTLLDPSGPLARLCSMPELRPYSRVLNLTGSEQGTLAPYALIPTPLRSEFGVGAAGDREFEIAVSNARAERRMLVQDICMMLVPPQVAREASTATLFRHAVRQVPAEEASTLDDVVACLQGLDDDAGRELANLLLDTAEMPLAMLFFGRPPEGLLGADAALTVITMAGLRLPDLKIEREYWSAEEALALPMLHTAHRLAVRRCYGGSMSSRKLVGLDEAHFMEGWRSGRSFLVRLARDSRKWNLAALVASQNPKDILGLDVQNLVSTVFVGRIAEDTEIASEALRLLRVPVNDGYEATLASLSTADAGSAARLGFREFVMRDVDGRVQKVRVDVSYVDGLLDHLDTTPAAVAQAAGQLPTVPADLEA
ncbi:AAA-like domain-containing protein [Micromonospora rhizosphaerae]|uniref:AAA-like domain-containing protein n=1 Tax=Micromonospora rhizosphaerae TaxID=568872 RepID=A0A1C6RCF1_9ACTN|nr:ATP-binding protein [Micromonospora rhizosphaerae]SCL14740.1 AAA-like domain-containing protein [Micromonospora rhizosphaerae]